MKKLLNESYSFTTIEMFIHCLAWGLLFFTPFILFERGMDIQIPDDFLFKLHSILPIEFIILFYLNYLFFIPQFLFKPGKLNKSIFILVNIIVIFLKNSFVHFYYIPHYITPEVLDLVQQDIGVLKPENDFLSPFLRDIFFSVTIVFITIIIKIALRTKREQYISSLADKARMEAEIKNLRCQLSPHFMLNTLNNIYALIEFDQKKAQEAVKNLSILLRHMIYNTNDNEEKLSNLVKIVHQYVNLMRLRFSKEVEIEEDYDVKENNGIKIAHMLIIPLIENAFKHGVSPSKKSIIRIKIKEISDKEMYYCISNTNHSKKDTNRSDSGIGLENLARRLELLYPGQHIWEKTENEEWYVSKIIIRKQ